jgi:hypothetical protein
MEGVLVVIALPADEAQALDEAGTDRNFFA